MSAFLQQLDLINSTCRDTFGTETISYQQRRSGAVVGPAISLTAIPIDPIRLESTSAGQFAVRWVKLADLAAAGLTAAKGDLVTITSSANVTGGTYVVNQIQEDTGGGIRLILILREQRART